MRDEPFGEGLTVGVTTPVALTGPAVVLVNPKYPHNVGGAIRACAAFGLAQCWWTGDRVTIPQFGGRLPREERMKGYRSVALRHDERPFDRGASGTPVCVEIWPGATALPDFKHPDDAVYVFGPEDGAVPKAYRVLCHAFIQIPAAHCLNLAAAINVVLYDRRVKQGGA